MLDLSTELKCSYKTIYDLAEGVANPTLDTLLKVANYFHLTISQLIGERPLGEYISAFIKLVPILQFSEVEEFLGNTNHKLNSQNILISSEKFLSEYAFTINANNETEPIFKIGTILVFDKVELDIKSHNNKFVLVKTEYGSIAIKKLFVENQSLFLQPVNIDIPPQPISPNNIKFLAYLIQTKIEY